MATTVTSSYERGSAEAEETTGSCERGSAEAGETTVADMDEDGKEDVEEDEEFFKEFFTGDLVAFEKILSWVERVPMLCIIVFHRSFPVCLGFASQLLGAINIIYAVFFTGRVMFCRSAITFDPFSFYERIAFLVVLVAYYSEYFLFWEIASNMFKVSNGLSIVFKVYNWLRIEERFLSLVGFLFSSNCQKSDVEVDEQPKKKQAILQEADTELSDELQKTNEIIGSEQAKTEEIHKREVSSCDGKFLVDSKAGDFLGDSELEERCLKLEEENNVLARRFDAASEAFELYRGIEKSFDEHRVKWDCEKKDLAVKLDESIEATRHYQRDKKTLAARLEDTVETLRQRQQEKKDLVEYLDDIVDTLRHCQQEKTDLEVKLDDTVEMLRHYKRIANDYSCKDQRWGKETHNLLSEPDALNNSSPWKSAATAAKAATGAVQNAANAAANASNNSANLQSDDEDSQTPSAGAQHSIECQKIRGANLTAKRLNAASTKSSSQYNPPSINAAAAAAADFSIASANKAAAAVAANADNVSNAANHQSAIENTNASPFHFMNLALLMQDENKPLNWVQERNDLLAKLTATTAWYQYYIHAVYDYQLQNNNLFVERSDLSVKLQSANILAEFYKACLDDSEDECGKLKEENDNLSAKLSAKTSDAEHNLKLVHETEEKCSELEEEKNELEAKLCAAKAASQLYRSYLHDAGS